MADPGTSNSAGVESAYAWADRAPRREPKGGEPIPWIHWYRNQPGNHAMPLNSAMKAFRQRKQLATQALG